MVYTPRIIAVRGRKSAGLLVFREHNSTWEVFLVHPGGPFWERKDLGAWSLPKGECAEGEDPLTAAKREFGEETSLRVDGEFVPLGEIIQPGRKIISIWAIENDLDPAKIKSNTFSMEWPPKSGQRREFPEVDKAGWFTLGEAATKIVKGQVGFLHRLAEKLDIPFRAES